MVNRMYSKMVSMARLRPMIVPVIILRLFTRISICSLAAGSVDLLTGVGMAYMRDAFAIRKPVKKRRWIVHPLGVRRCGSWVKVSSGERKQTSIADSVFFFISLVHATGFSASKRVDPCGFVPERRNFTMCMRARNHAGQPQVDPPEATARTAVGIREKATPFRLKVSAMKYGHSLFAKKDKDGTMMKWPMARHSIPMLDVSMPMKKKNPESKWGRTKSPSWRESFIENSRSTRLSI